MSRGLWARANKTNRERILYNFCRYSKWLSLGRFPTHHSELLRMNWGNWGMMLEKQKQKKSLLFAIIIFCPKELTESTETEGLLLKPYVCDFGFSNSEKKSVPPSSDGYWMLLLLEQHQKPFHQLEKAWQACCGQLWLLIYDWTINRVIQPVSGEWEFFVLPRKENSSLRDALSHNYQTETKTQAILKWLTVWRTVIFDGLQMKLYLSWSAQALLYRPLL